MTSTPQMRLIIRMALSSILVWNKPITVVRASHQPAEPPTTPATTKLASWKLPAPPASPPRLANITPKDKSVTGLVTVKAKVERVEGVSDDVVAMRQQAQGAGTLGRWLIKIGIAVVTIAGWAVGAYTYLTGRPPP